MLLKGLLSLEETWEQKEGTTPPHHHHHNGPWSTAGEREVSTTA